MPRKKTLVLLARRIEAERLAQHFRPRVAGHTFVSGIDRDDSLRGVGHRDAFGGMLEQQSSHPFNRCRAVTADTTRQRGDRTRGGDDPSGADEPTSGTRPIANDGDEVHVVHVPLNLAGRRDSARGMRD